MKGTGNSSRNDDARIRAALREFGQAIWPHRNQIIGMELVPMATEDPQARVFLRLVNEGNQDEALELAQDEAQWTSQRCRLTRLAVICNKMDLFGEAINACKDLAVLCTERFDQSVPVSYLSAISIHQGKLAKARSFATTAIELYPSWAGPWLNLLCAYSLEEDEKGIAQALELLRSKYPAWGMNEYFKERLRVDPQLAYFRRVVELGSENEGG